MIEQHFCVEIYINNMLPYPTEAGILLWLMVGDFNVFCAVVPNPVERLHLKQFVKTYSTSIESTITSAMCTKDKDTEDD